MTLKVFGLKVFLVLKRAMTVARVRLTHKVMGKHFMIPRYNAPKVEAYLYEPRVKSSGKRPLLVNVHGGAWVVNDALVMDTQSQTIANELGAFVVNINYKKADRRAFPYSQYEVVDTVKYFVAHANEYSIDINRIVLMGYSAGAHLCAVAVQKLRDDGILVDRQVLCYPFTDFTCNHGKHTEIQRIIDKIDFLDEVVFKYITRDDPMSSPMQNPNLKGLPPAIITTCGGDVLCIQGEDYAKQLKLAGVDVIHIHEEESVHGFMECNWPETRKDDSKSPKQEKLCRKQLAQIINLLKK